MYFVKFKYSVTYTSDVFKITSFYGVRHFLGTVFRLVNIFFFFKFSRRFGSKYRLGDELQ
jgi:hypothetical protein